MVGLTAYFLGKVVAHDAMLLPCNVVFTFLLLDSTFYRERPEDLEPPLVGILIAPSCVDSTNSTGIYSGELPGHAVHTGI